MALHDPLAAAVLARPELCVWADRRATVEDRGRSTAADSAGSGTTLRTAVDVDPPRSPPSWSPSSESVPAGEPGAGGVGGVGAPSLG